VVRETESGVTGWLTANRHGRVSTGIGKASLPLTCLSFGTGCSWIAVELNLKCSD